MVAPTTPNISGIDTAVLLTKTLDDGTKLNLVVGKGQHRFGEVTFGGNFCVIGTPAQDGAAISAAVSAWAGVPPIPPAEGSSSVYMFTDEQDGHHPIPKLDTATWIALSQGGKVVFVMNQTSPNGMTSIAYFHSVKLGADARPH